MKRYWKLLPLLTWTISLLLPQDTLAQSVPSADDVIAEVNALRAENDLPPYEVDLILMVIAQQQAEFMAGRGTITHFGEDGSRPYQRALKAGYAVAGDLTFGGFFSENVDAGEDLTPEEVVTGWAGNPADLKTMLSADFEDIGVGVATEDGITYYVVDVGKSTGLSVSPPVASPAVIFTSRPGTPGTEVAPVVTSTALEDGSVYHIVEADQALWSIAQAYGLTIDELKQINRLSSDEIFIGQKLLISVMDTPTPTVEVLSTATFGIPTSTATRRVTPTVTSTYTPTPAAPQSLKGGGTIVGGIVGAALLAAGLVAWLGRKKPAEPEQ
jgi:LysM repeat protein